MSERKMELPPLSMTKKGLGGFLCMSNTHDFLQERERQLLTLLQSLADLEMPEAITDQKTIEREVYWGDIEEGGAHVAAYKELQQWRAFGKSLSCVGIEVVEGKVVGR